jgi:hypothetical protein
MLYELRIYRCLPGRLPALHKRFQEATLGDGPIVANITSSFLAPAAYSKMK